MLKLNYLHATVRLLMAAGFCAGAFAPVLAHPSSNDLPFAGLVVLPEATVQLTARNQADYDCGRISTVEKTQVEHCFTVRNEGKTSLTIVDLESNCHCTTAVVEKISGRTPVGEVHEYRLDPGQEMTIRVSVQLARQLSGPMSHGVMVHVADQLSPIARLFLIGEVEAGLMLPSELSFGLMKRGEPQSQTMTVMCDERLLSRAELPRLEAQCATNIAGKASAIITIVPQAESRSRKAANSISTQRVKTYVVTVQPEQTGPLTASLSFASISPTEYQGSIPYDRAKEIFGGTQVEVTGEVAEK
jgi:hypothetical protein